MCGWAGLRAVALAILLVPAVGTPGRADAGAAIPGERTGPDAGGVQDFGLVSGAEGWVRSGAGLYRTDSGGQGWRDISPADPAGAAIVDAFFLDAERGWVVTGRPEGAGAAEWTLARTADGGATWESRPLDLFPDQAAVAPASAAYLHFIDEATGWLAVVHASSSNFSIGSLFKTADGGRTWTQRSLPIGEPVYFVSKDVGWTAGGAAGDELYRTVDGGASWQSQAVAAGPDVGDGRRFYTLPAFRNPREGLLAAVTAGEGARLELYATGDGGATWRRTAALPAPQGATPAEGLPLALVPDERAAVLAEDGRLVTASEEGEITARAAGQGVAGRITRLEMATTGAGWALESSGTCTPAGDGGAGSGSGSELVCRSEARLLGTTDGGRSWTRLELPQAVSTAAVGPLAARTVAGERPGGPIGPSRTAVMTGQGFDKCEIATLSQLRTWFAQSPYRAVNLYIGGGARACGNAALSASLLSQLSEIGWAFIPTWVGPQPPCTSYSLRMSDDPATARAQGVDEANKAADVAAVLGLGPGTVLYHDVEYYDTSNTKCHTAVKAFVSGWSSQVRARGSLAGVYGTGGPLSAFAFLSDAPDVIWPANWVQPYAYRETATVWDVAGLSNTLWSEHQRIRQYTGGHNETWGGVTLNLDCDAIDGIVASLGPPVWGYGVYLPLVDRG